MRRRLAPLWIRDTPDRELHALTGRLIRESRSEDLSARQDWLLDRCLNELAYRRDQDLRRKAWPCTCWLCMPEDWFDA